MGRYYQAKISSPDYDRLALRVREMMLFQKQQARAAGTIRKFMKARPDYSDIPKDTKLIDEETFWRYFHTFEELVDLCQKSVFRKVFLRRDAQFPWVSIIRNMFDTDHVEYTYLSFATDDRECAFRLLFIPAHINKFTKYMDHEPPSEGKVRFIFEQMTWRR